jgi:hypothetical protein
MREPSGPAMSARVRAAGTLAAHLSLAIRKIATVVRLRDPAGIRKILLIMPERLRSAPTTLLGGPRRHRSDDPLEVGIPGRIAVDRHLLRATSSFSRLMLWKSATAFGWALSI